MKTFEKRAIDFAYNIVIHSEDNYFKNVYLIRILVYDIKMLNFKICKGCNLHSAQNGYNKKII